MMTRLRELGRRLWYLGNRRRLDGELRQEMEAHRELMDAPARFGNALRLREDAEDVWGWRWLDDAARDAAIAGRALRRRPGISAVIVGSLALAIGATTAIFTIVHGVLLRPLPFAAPDRLVQVFGRAWLVDGGGAADRVDSAVGSLQIEAFQRQSATLADLAGYSSGSGVIDGREGPERVTIVTADLNLFTVLGARPLEGRTFQAGDAADVVVISERLWERRWRRDPAIVGQTVQLTGRPMLIVGVVPESFQFPYSAGSILPAALPEARTDLWRPLEPLRSGPDGALRRGRVSVVARLAPGVTVANASAELRGIGERLAESAATPNARYDAHLVPLVDAVVHTVRPALWLLFAGVALVLAASCANVANLLLAQMTLRVREVTTRAALGARPSRLVRQFLAESLLLSLAAGLGGMALAAWLVQILGSVAAPYLPRAHEIGVDWPVFAFALGVSVVTAVTFGLAPAIAGASVDAGAIVREGGHATTGRRFGRIRDGLVVVEVALASALVLGALVVMREAGRLEQTSPGFTATNVLTLHLMPRVSAAEYAAIVERVSQLPGVRDAAVIQLLPLQHWGWEGEFRVRGRQPTERAVSELRYVTPGYFQTLEIPLLRGRGFTAMDVAGAAPVIVINDALARRYFAGEDPIGIETDRGVIVGVVADVRQARLGRAAAPEIYYPIAQNLAVASDAGMSLVIRADHAPETLTGAVRAAVRDVAPALAVFNVKTLAQVRRESLAELHLTRWLTGLFAALALALAAIGLGGVIAFHAASRRREFAVRLALGAEPRAIAQLVIGRAARLTAVGLIGGAMVTLAMTPLAATLPGMSAAATDAVMFVSVVVAIGGLAALASVVPAIRAARVSPIAVLRHE